MTDTIDRLVTRFPLHSRATVAEIVSQAHQRYDDSDLRDFIPLLVEREARRKLEHTTTQAAPTQEPSSEPSGPASGEGQKGKVSGQRSQETVRRSSLEPLARASYA